MPQIDLNRLRQQVGSGTTRANTSSSTSGSDSPGCIFVLLVGALAAAVFVFNQSGSSANNAVSIPATRAPQTSASAPVWQMPGSQESATLERAHEQIGVVYKRVMSTLTLQQQELLRREQREWIKWRDEEADRTARRTSVGGSAYRIDFLNAMIGLVRQRTDYLNRYSPHTSLQSKTPPRIIMPPPNSKPQQRVDEESFRNSVRQLNKF